MVAEVEIEKLKQVWKSGCLTDLVTAVVAPTIHLLSRIQIEFHTEVYIMEVILAARKSLFTKRQLNMCCSKNMSTVSS
jgi:hypothetical protein